MRTWRLIVALAVSLSVPVIAAAQTKHARSAALTELDQLEREGDVAALQ
jgi:hypothetical protein